MRALLLFLLLFFSGCTLLKHLTNSKEPSTLITLLIVNEKYSGGRELKTIKGGIRKFKRVLERIGVDEVLPIEYDVTYSGLQRAFDKLESKIKDKKNTNIFIYFSGHGVMSKDLSNAYVEMIDENNRTLVNLNVFYDFINKINVRATVLAIDACRDKDNISTVNRIEGKMKTIPRNLYMSYPIQDAETTLGVILGEEVTFYLKSLTKHIIRNIDAKDVFNAVGKDLIEELQKYNLNSNQKRIDTLNKEFFFYHSLEGGILTAG